MSNPQKNHQTPLFERTTAAVKSDRGIRHETNEDAFSVVRAEGYRLYIVADGMGGPSKGEIASHLALSTIETFLKPKREITSEDLVAAIERGNRALIDLSSAGPNFTGIGTTLSAIAFLKDSVYVAHVGNSRIYHIGRQFIRQLTTDHTLRQEGVSDDTLIDSDSQERGRTLTRYLGSESAVQIELQRYEDPISDGDLFLVCSDGLSEAVSAEEISRIVRAAEVKKAARDLVQRANEVSGEDNVTVILVRVGEEVPPAVQHEDKASVGQPAQAAIEFPTALNPGAAGRIGGAVAAGSIFGASSDFLGNAVTTKKGDGPVVESKTTNAKETEFVQETTASTQPEATVDPIVNYDSDDDEFEAEPVVDEDPDSTKKKRKRKRKRKKRRSDETGSVESVTAETSAAETPSVVAVATTPVVKEATPLVVSKENTASVKKERQTAKEPRAIAPEATQSADVSTSQNSSVSEFDDYDDHDLSDHTESNDLEIDEATSDYSVEEEQQDSDRIDSNEEYSYLRPPPNHYQRSRLTRRIVIAMFIGFGCGAVLAVASRGGNDSRIARMQAPQQIERATQPQGNEESPLQELLNQPTSPSQIAEQENLIANRIAPGTSESKAVTSEDAEVAEVLKRAEIAVVSQDQSEVPETLPTVMPAVSVPREERVFTKEVIGKVQQITDNGKRTMVVEVYGAIRETVVEADKRLNDLAERQLDTFEILDRMSSQLDELVRIRRQGQEKQSTEKKSSDEYNS